MRTINEIIVHCSDTRIDQRFTVDDIRSWHLKRGWKDIGYHFYIDLDGEIHKGRSISVIGAHCYGRNRYSIGICLEGGKKADGKPWDRPNEKQIKSFKRLEKKLEFDLGTPLAVSGHYEYSDVKTCPNFDIDILKD